MRFYFFIILLFFISCKNDNSKEVNAESKNTGLVINDTLNISLSNGIPVPKKVYYRSFSPKGFNFTYPSKDKVFLYDYNLDKKKWDIKSLPFEGRNGIIKIGFYEKFISPSRLLYFPYGVNRLLLFDENYKLLKSYDFSEGYTLSFPMRFNCYLNNDIVYFPSLTQEAYVNFKNFTNTRLITKLNLKTGKKEQIIKVPSDFYGYHSNILFDMSPEFVFPNDSTIVFIMLKSPNLYVYNIKTDKTKSYFYPDEKIKYTEEDIRLAMNNPNYIWSKGFYRNLHYDNVNQIYYRISVNPISRNTNGSVNTPIRVTAFDEKFNLLAKEVFKDLFPTYSFVNKTGLYIVEKGSLENSMRFRHIVLEKNTEL